MQNKIVSYSFTSILIFFFFIQLLLIGIPQISWTYDNYDNKVKINADEFDIDLESGEGVAKGNIHIEDPNYYTLTANLLLYNFTTNQYKLHDAHLFLFPSRHINSTYIEKKNPDTFNLKDMYFTSCDNTRSSPIWSISARRGEVSPNNYLKINHLIVRLKKLPLFYLPKLSVPLNKAGYAGLKLPEIGSSSRNGLTIKMQYNAKIMPFNKSELYLDYYEKQGIGSGALLKYNNNKLLADIKFYGIIKKNNDTDDKDTYHGSIDCTLSKSTDSGQRIVFDLHQTDDKDFYYDYERKTSLFQESRAFINTTRPPFSFLLHWDQIKTLRIENEERTHWPQFSIHSTPFPLKIHPSMVTAMTGLHGSFADVINNDTKQGIIAPYFTLKVPIRTLLDIKAEFGFDTIYQESIDPNNAHDLEKKYYKNYKQVITLTGPRLFRKYKNIFHLTYIRMLYHANSITIDDDAVVEYPYLNYYASAQKKRYLTISMLNRFLRLKAAILELDIKEHFYLIEKSKQTEIYFSSSPNETIKLNLRLYYNNDITHRLDFDLIFKDKTKQNVTLSWLYNSSDQNRTAENVTSADTFTSNTIKISYTSPLIKSYQVCIAKYLDIERNDYDMEDKYQLIYSIECFSCALTFMRNHTDTSVKANLNIRF